MIFIWIYNQHTRLVETKFFFCCSQIQKDTWGPQIWWIRSDQTWKYALTKNLRAPQKKYPRVPEVKVMLGFIFNCVIAHQRLGLLPRHTKFPFMLSHLLKIERNSFFPTHSWKDQSVEFSRVNVSMRRIPRVWRKEARGLSLLSAYVWPTFPTDERAEYEGGLTKTSQWPFFASE